MTAGPGTAGSPHRVSLPGGPEVWCTHVPAAVVMWREMLPPGAYHRAAAGLRDGGTLLDIGANIGLMSLYCARLRPGIRVIAVEPAPELHACLERNLARHTTGAVAECLAVTDRPGLVRFTYYPGAPGNSGIRADREADDEITRVFLRNTGVGPEDAEELLEGLHDGIELTVPAVTVSDLVRRYGLTRVDLLKVDVERAELDVLRGVEPGHWPLIRSVVAEAHDENGRLAELAGLLLAQGFEVSVHQDPLLSGTGLYDVEARRPG
ncbi:FkbM family methyltransferase [Streptomyces sp. NPDC004609]|uniref:FkbM family methyltransferase n=1 Tax=Streptomyces sp. NPDC004609 TaxID=3364704 RepID=UPI0036C99982